MHSLAVSEFRTEFAIFIQNMANFFVVHDSYHVLTQSGY